MLAGGFVLASIALAVGSVLLLSGVLDDLGPKATYRVTFLMTDGTAGLKQGSKVTLGGQPVGEVSSIRFAGADPASPESVEVWIRVAKSVALYDNAWVYLERPLLGSMGTINIARTGGPTPDGRGGGKRLMEGGTMAGRLAPPAFLAQAGYGPDEAEAVTSLIQTALQLVERADRVLAGVEAREEEVIGGLADAVRDARAVTAEVRTKMDEWSGSVDRTLANVEHASQRLAPVLDETREGLAEARGVVGQARDLIDANRPTFDRSMANVETITSNLADVGPKIDTMLDESANAARQFADAGRQASDLMRQEAPSIRRTLANLRLAADQFKLVAIEVRRNPWRLLYTPSTKELESELLYDAARTYAEAVSDLRSASASLEAVAAGAPAPDRESIEDLTSRLRDAFSRYEAAEQRFLQLVIEKTE